MKLQLTNSKARVMYDPGIDVVVVNWRTPKLLEDFVVSLIVNVPVAPINVWLFNNQADYDSYAYAEICRKVNIWHLWSDENKGYARAVNESVEQGNRECIAIFNSDTKFLTNILDTCYAELMGHQDWGVVGPKQVNAQNQIVHGGIIGTNTHPLHRWWKDIDTPEKDIVDENCVSVSGSAYMIKRAVWDAIVANDDYQRAHKEVLGEPAIGFPMFQHYYEDMLMSLMVRHFLKQKVVYLGTQVMMHHWHASSDIGSKVDQQMPEVRDKFRKMCEIMGIEHE